MGIINTSFYEPLAYFANEATEIEKTCIDSFSFLSVNTIIVIGYLKKNAVLDTNIFLHYDIKTVDWCKELDASEVEIIVCPTVLRELDDKKGDERKVLAERARKNLHLIDCIDEKREEIRKNVKMTVLVEEPKVDWNGLGLDKAVKDDRTIASIIERGNVEDVLVTDDTTPRIKARNKGIKCVQLKADRLPEPRSDLEIELAKTKRELQEYKNRAPELSLFLHADEQEENRLPKFLLKKPRLMTQADIEQIIAVKRIQYNKNTGSSQDYLNPYRLPDMQAHMDLMNYLTRYRKYLEKKNEIEQLRCATIPIKFDICCDGTAPAENVRCYIEFPEGFEIIEETELQERLKQPEEPTMTHSNAFSTTKEVTHFIGSMDPQNAGSQAMSIDVDSNIIDVTVESIPHNHCRPIEGLLQNYQNQNLQILK